eukprot:SAG25_NODE_331_length_9668_cov_3.863518_11_plen_74_part_00
MMASACASLVAAIATVARTLIPLLLGVPGVDWSRSSRSAFELQPESCLEKFAGVCADGNDYEQQQHICRRRHI